MRSFTSSSTVSAAKIIAIQRATGISSPAVVVYETPEAGAGTSAYVQVTTTWLSTTQAVVGGYLVDEGSGNYGFIPAAAFEGIYTLATP